MQNSGLNPKSSVRCTWNGSEIFSRKIVTSPTPSISGEVVIRPNTPPKPSISGEVILRPTTPTKPVDVLASITITVDGKNQPDIYNTYKLNEKEAISYCANLASKVLTTSKFSCIWNGKELGKGFGTKVVVVTKPTVPVTPLATLIMNSDYWGMQTQANMSEGSAKEVCESTWKKYETNSRYTSLVCTWNGRTVFSKTKFSSTNTGTVVVPKTPVSTGSTSSGVTNTGTLGLGKMDILVNNQARNPEYNISRSEALTKCIGYLPSIPVSSIVLCKWNGTTIYTGNGYILSNTGSWYYPTTGTGTLPKTPVSTGSTASGVITPAKPVDVLASITVTVDGKNQPDIYNTYKLNEMEAMNYCANLASKVLTTSKFSCIWNGKELGKGFGTKVVTTTSTGSWYYPTTGTGTLPKTPVSTGSTSNTVITVNS